MDYDLFCSLGGSCASSHQLKERRLRVASLPFDWLFCTDDRTLENLTECFRCDFGNWLLRGNLRELAPEERGQSKIFQCKDLATGYRFIHDFHRDPAAGDEYDEVKAKYDRRIQRLYEFLNAASRIAFLFDAGFPVDLDRVQALRHLLQEKFGSGKTFDFYIAEFSSAAPGVEKRDGITVFRYGHDKHNYLYMNKSFEFAFLDDMQLSGRIASPPGRNGFLEINRLPTGFRAIFFRRAKQWLRFRLRLWKKHVELIIGNPWE